MRIGVGSEEFHVIEQARALDRELVGLSERVFGVVPEFEIGPDYYLAGMRKRPQTEFSGVEQIGDRSHLIARWILFEAVSLERPGQSVGYGDLPKPRFALTRKIVDLLSSPLMRGMSFSDSARCAATEPMFEARLQWHQQDRTPKLDRQPAVILTDANERPIAYQMSEGTEKVYVFADGELPLSDGRTRFLPKDTIVELEESNHFSERGNDSIREWQLPARRPEARGRGVVLGVGPQAYDVNFLRFGNVLLPYALREACVTSSVRAGLNQDLQPFASAALNLNADSVYRRVRHMLENKGGDILRLSAIEAVSS